MDANQAYAEDGFGHGKDGYLHKMVLLQAHHSGTAGTQRTEAALPGRLFQTHLAGVARRSPSSALTQNPFRRK